jgi:U6 snRNA-associated Sm-like protein LSm8
MSKTEVVMVVTSDGRVIVGNFVGHDQVQNLILKEAHERVFSEDADVERVPLGLYVVRGDTVCLIGDFDDAAIDDSIRVPFQLPAIQQQQF